MCRFSLKDDQWLLSWIFITNYRTLWAMLLFDTLLQKTFVPRGLGRLGSWAAHEPCLQRFCQSCHCVTILIFQYFPINRSSTVHFPTSPRFEMDKISGRPKHRPFAAGAHGLIFLPVLLSLLGPSMDGSGTEVVKIDNAEVLESNSEHSPKVAKGTSWQRSQVLGHLRWTCLGAAGWLDLVFIHGFFVITW